MTNGEPLDYIRSFAIPWMATDTVAVVIIARVVVVVAVATTRIQDADTSKLSCVLTHIHTRALIIKLYVGFTFHFLNIAAIHFDTHNCVCVFILFLDSKIGCNFTLNPIMLNIV